MSYGGDDVIDDSDNASKTCSQTVTVMEPTTSAGCATPQVARFEDEDDYISCTSLDSNCSHISLRHAKNCRHIATKSAMTTPIECKNWDEFEGRLLRVLNYKYYEKDTKTLYRNVTYKDGKTQSDPYMVEGVMQTIIYDEYEDRARPLEIIRSTLPCRQQPEIVYIRGRLWRNFLKFWWNVLTFKFCRSGRRRCPSLSRQPTLTG